MNNFKLIALAGAALAFHSAFAQGLSPACIDELRDVAEEDGFAAESFLKELPAAALKVKAQEKAGKILLLGAFLGAGSDNKITDIGLSIGCLKSFPESANEMPAAVKSVSLELAKISAAKLAGKSASSSAVGDDGWALQEAPMAAAAPAPAEAAAPAAQPSQCPKAATGTFTDARDNKEYKQVNICGQVWMAENLDYKASGSECYNDEPENCDAYGRLYNWATAMTACPVGWHLPSSDEWNALTDFIGASSKAPGKSLKAKFGWNNDGNGIDDYKFAALPGGYRSQAGGFGGVRELGYWWTSTEEGADARNRNIGSVGANVSESYHGKPFGFSVRCVRDGRGAEPPKDGAGIDISQKDDYREIDSGIEKSGGNASFWVALGFDLVGAGFISYGIIKHLEAKDLHSDYKKMEASGSPQPALDKAWRKVKDAKEARNISYLIGGTALGLGIGIHVIF